MTVKKYFLLAVVFFFTSSMVGCGTNVYKGLDSKSSADLKLCLDYGDYDCVLGNLDGTVVKSDPALNVLYAKAELQKAGFNILTIMDNAITYDFDNANLSTATKFSNLYKLSSGVDPTLLSDATGRFNDSIPTIANELLTAGISNLLNGIVTIYAKYDTNADGKLDTTDTALQNATTATSTWNSIKGNTSSYNSGFLGNIQAAADDIKLAYTGSKTGTCPDDSKTCSNLTKAGEDAKNQLNTAAPAGATDADILNGILCLDGGTKSDGSACS